MYGAYGDSGIAAVSIKVCMEDFDVSAAGRLTGMRPNATLLSSLYGKYLNFEAMRNLTLTFL